MAALLVATLVFTTAAMPMAPRRAVKAAKIKKHKHAGKTAPTVSPPPSTATPAPATTATTPATTAPAKTTPATPPAKTTPATTTPPPPRTAAPSPAAATATTREPATIEAAATVVEPHELPHELVELALDGGIGARRLQYTQAITNNLPTYSVAAVPWLGFRGALFPFARTSVPVLRDVGLYGDFGHSLYQQSVVAGSTQRLDAAWTSYDAGVRARVPLPRRAAVGLAFGYGGVSFLFQQNGQLVGDTPSVDYRYLRPAVDARLSLGPVTFWADFGYRALLSAGYVASHFPHASVGGVDLGAGVSVSLPRHFALSLSGQYQRYFYDLKPQPGDPYVAGGALDELGVGELALAYVY